MIPSRPSAPPARLFRAAALAALLAAAPAGTARAQSYQTYDQGLTFGHFLVYPSVSFEYTRDSNIFYTGADDPTTAPTSSGIAVVRPRILVDLPLRDNRIRWVYAPFYRDYTSQSFTGSNRLNHAFDLDGRFRAHRAITLALRDHFVRGTVSLQEQTAGNGLSFGLGRFSAHNPALEIGVNLGARQGLSFIPSYSRFSFSGINDSIQYTYTARKLENRYNYRLSEPATLYGYYAFEADTQDQMGVQDIRIRSRSSGLGLTRTVNETVVTQMSAGYQTMDFEGGTGRNFSGLVVDAGASLLLSDASRIEFAIVRHPYSSVYPGNNYYVDNEARVHLTFQIGPSTYVDVAAAGLRNVYAPQSGPGRTDRLTRLEIGMGHQFLRTLRGYVGATFENRRSNVEQVIGGEDVDPFRIRVNRLLFRLEVGWM